MTICLIIFNNVLPISLVPKIFEFLFGNVGNGHGGESGHWWQCRSIWGAYPAANSLPFELNSHGRCSRWVRPSYEFGVEGSASFGGNLQEIYRVRYHSWGGGSTTATPSCSGINFVFEQFTPEFILPCHLMCSFNTINNNKSRLAKWSRNANNGGKTNNKKHPSSSSNNINNSNINHKVNRRLLSH